MSDRSRLSPLAATLALVGGLTVARVIALALTPLELYPDEAQYWLWSRDLAWGYFSKPPMVAWLVAAFTRVGGDEEPWIRVAATLAHAVAPLALYAAGARLYDRWTGFWAAALYSLMPGVQLSAGVMTTDAPLLMFLSLALLAYARLMQGGGRWTAAGFGLALGLAFLSKYAALYMVAGAALHASVSREMRAAWSARALAAAVAAFALSVGPNLVWNAAHGFATVAHTAANANWADQGLFNLGELADFLGAQFGVFGPVPFLVLLSGVVALGARGGVRREDAALLCLAAAPLVLVAAQAFISRANANWAAAAYPAASVLVAAWLVRWRARRLLAMAVATQAAIAAVFLAVVVSPVVMSRLGLDGGFKRARGWSAMSAAISARVERGDWSAVAVDDRFLFNALAYYGRETWSRPGAPRLVMWVRAARPGNQAEAASPLTPALAARVLHVNLEPAYRAEAARDYRSWRPLGEVAVRLDDTRARRAALYAASGYARAPRDRLTGLPTAP